MIFRKTTRGARLPLLLTLATAVGLPLSAQEQGQAYVRRGTLERQGQAWVEEVACGAAVRPGGRLAVRADFGAIEVKPGANNQMRCRVRLRVYTASKERARRTLSRYEVGVRSLDGGASLRGRFREPGPVRLDVQFHIQVPRRFNLGLETSGGNLTVEELEGELQGVTAGGDIRSGDVTGRVRLKTAGGNILLGNIGGQAEATTAGGNILAGNIQGDALLETSGGKIVAGRIAGRVRAETAGGDVLLRGVGSDVIAETAGGQIQIGDTGGTVRAQTAGGSIKLESARGLVQVETAGGSLLLYQLQSGVQAVTMAGKILAQIAASPTSFQSSSLENSFGDVEVYLPPDLPLTIDASIDMAAGHKIFTDFPLEIQGGEQTFHKQTLRCQGELNGGGEVLRIRTQAGNIEIRKLDAQILERLQQRQKALWNYWEKYQKKLEEYRRQRQENEPDDDSTPGNMTP